VGQDLGYEQKGHRPRGPQVCGPRSLPPAVTEKCLENITTHVSVLTLAPRAKVSKLFLAPKVAILCTKS
jgi:hypothetical protein